MDIYAYLKSDHKKVEELFKKILDNTNKDTNSLFKDLKKELQIHMQAEESTFYKAISAAKKGEKDARHGDQEHHQILSMLEKLDGIFSAHDHSNWKEQLEELKKLVQHHVKDEEGDMFEDAKKIISAQEAKRLAEEMDNLKIKLSKEV